MKRNIFLIFIFIFAIFYDGGADGFQFIDCGSKVGKFTGIVVSDCDTTKNECFLKRNSTVSITINFTLGEDCSSVNTVVHGKIMGVDMPFHLVNPNACADSGLKCPLKKDSSYEYKAILPVLKIYPKVKVEVKWELQDQNGDDIVCVLIPAKIV